VSFRAKYNGWCVECEEPIRAGDEIQYDAADQVVHVSCAASDRTDVQGNPRPVCPRCFQMKSVSGACGCDE
jgi:hypothetical protein